MKTIEIETESDQPAATRQPKPTAGAPSGWPELRAWAEHLEDLQRAAIATENRARKAPDPELFEAHIEAVRGALHSCVLALRRCYRRSVPADVRAWQEKHPGLGEHLVARLLGHLGHPVHAEPKHWEGTGEARVLVADAPRERMVSQLWQLCGHGDPARKKIKGMTAEEAAALGNPNLKMLVHLLAESCVRTKTVNAGRYGDVYDLRRIVTAARVHAAPCVRCGPSGKSALAGSPWSKAHAHADALRIVGKEILRDLWVAGHETTEAGHPACETQERPARPRHSPKTQAARRNAKPIRTSPPVSTETQERAIRDPHPTPIAPAPATKKARAGHPPADTHVKRARPRRRSPTPLTIGSSKPRDTASVPS